uniref:FAS1 domain-containing protein n=1 Tax=Ananas comosus var. bracteatus TaxID=296719 RepID=A0A6V7QAH2_ANACO|nr:unnamed protein product [Ananas comosus var. bracteatus]
MMVIGGVPKVQSHEKLPHLHPLSPPPLPILLHHHQNPNPSPARGRGRAHAPGADQHHRDPREGRAVPDLHPPAQVDAGCQPDQQRAEQHAERPDDLRPDRQRLLLPPSGTLNSLTDQQKDSLIQYHILPYFLSASQFQTVSNPLRTQAGDSSDGQYPLNVTAVGNQVNISTGLVNTTVDNTVYTDGQLAVYQVDQVLLPLGVFRPSVPPAPSPSEQQKKKKSASAAEGPALTTPADSTSGSLAVGAGRDNHVLVFAVVSVASIWWSL